MLMIMVVLMVVEVIAISNGGCGSDSCSVDNGGPKLKA